MTIQTLELCTGRGIFHTNNPSSNPRKAYQPISLEGIHRMLQKPERIVKDKAQWVIFSNITNEYGRDSKYLYKNANFYAIWADIDKSNLKIEELKEIMEEIGAYSFIYTTKSATQINPRYRLIVVLEKPVPACTYTELQQMLNVFLESYGIDIDNTNEKIGQLCFLPNAGQYYDFRIIESQRLSISKFHKLFTTKNLKVPKTLPNHRGEEKNRTKKNSKNLSNNTNLIQLFNSQFKVDDLLKKYGYTKKGNRWTSPLSKTQIAGVVVKGERWLSKHESDAMAGIGRQNKEGCSGDAFDLFCYFECQNSISGAFRHIQKFQ